MNNYIYDYDEFIADLDQEPMSLVDYQYLAARTINPKLTNNATEHHALHGLSSEVGELHNIYQKFYQGHGFDVAHAKKELGDILWFIAEYCTARGWSMAEIATMNINKLRERYPDGFDPDHSINRKEGDI